MRIEIKIFVVLILVSQSFVGYGQNYAQDMNKIRENFKSKPLTFRMTYKYYPFDSAKVASDSMRGNCYMNGANYYYKISGTSGIYEYVNNEKYYFIVDNTRKAIAINKSGGQNAEVWNVSELDSLVNSPSVKVTYVDLGKKEGEYILKMNKGKWAKIKVLYNKANYTLERIQMCSDSKGKIYGQPYSKPYVSINFTDYKQGAFDMKVISENKYFTVSPAGIITVDAYKGYRVRDYLKRN